MCDFEKNILILLLEEKKRISLLFTEKEAAYMKSLDHGILKAEKKLEECEYQKCVESVYKKIETIPANDMRAWFDYHMKLQGCRLK